PDDAGIADHRASRNPRTDRPNRSVEFDSKTRSACSDAPKYIDAVEQCTTRLIMNMTTKSRSLATETLDDPRWAAVVARDAKADGQFFYSVRTTGVYCRPSCAARTPRPENVAFHLTAIEAQS